MINSPFCGILSPRFTPNFLSWKVVSANLYFAFWMYILAATYTYVCFRWRHHKSFGVASLLIGFQQLTSPRFGCTTHLVPTSTMFHLHSWKSLELWFNLWWLAVNQPIDFQVMEDDAALLDWLETLDRFPLVLVAVSSGLVLLGLFSTAVHCVCSN